MRKLLNAPHSRQLARLRKGNALHPGERAYLQKREPEVRQALEQLLGRSLEGKKVPKIALSGRLSIRRIIIFIP